MTNSMFMPPCNRARKFGGDFYDFFFIGEDRFCFCIGEVFRKSVSAASFMSVTKSIIKSRAGDDFSPASILTHLNEELSAFNKAATLRHFSLVF